VTDEPGVISISTNLAKAASRPIRLEIPTPSIVRRMSRSVKVVVDQGSRTRVTIGKPDTAYRLRLRDRYREHDGATGWTLIWIGQVCRREWRSRSCGSASDDATHRIAPARGACRSRRA